MSDTTHTLFTYGYTGSTPDDLRAFAETLDATIADIRYSPRSRVPRWDGRSLAAQFPGRYLSVTALGNANFKGTGPIKIASPETGLAIVHGLLEHRSVILLCACTDVALCHRSPVARWLSQQLGVPFEHLPKKFSRRRKSAA